MANFGFSRLAVVAPFAPMWREARSAVGAPELLENALESMSLSEAVSDCTLVVGTGSLTYRKPEQRVVSLPDLAPLVGGELAQGGRVALVFGSEKHGLTREDLAFCHLLVNIPTTPCQPSMNLGQAVAVCLYELAVRASLPEVSIERQTKMGLDSSIIPEEHISEAEAPVDFAGGFLSGLKPRLASLSLPDPGCQPGDERLGTRADEGRRTVPSGTLDLLTGLVEETMQAAGYSPRSMQAANRRDLRLLLRRLALTEDDTRRILGLFRRILWRLKRNRESAPKLERKPEQNCKPGSARE
jgi:tRNA/rRNA methyltransferase